MHTGIRCSACKVVLALGCCGCANAAEGTFQVRVVVLPHGNSAVQQAPVAVPEGAVLLTRGPQLDSVAVHATPGQAAMRYRETMARLGFRLVADAGNTLAWDDGSRRVEVRLQPVLGAPAMTRALIATLPH